MTVTEKILLLGAMISCSVAVRESVCNVKLFVFIYVMVGSPIW